MAKPEIAKLVFGLAEYYDKVLTEAQYDMYVDDLSSMEPEDLVRAIKLYRNDPKNEKFPLPAKLKGMLEPSDEDQAREASGRIRQAISAIGPYSPGAARHFIGEVGWAVVTRFGGWQDICKISEDELPILQAQWRDLAKSQINRDKLGVRDEAPAFKNTPTLQNLGDLLKLPNLNTSEEDQKLIDPNKFKELLIPKKEFKEKTIEELEAEKQRQIQLATKAGIIK